ncbi:hypothetical protein [Glycomyces artemisiae]|uniref:Uncharacterized protein n=1 Tax=Glycomyces artemisiae TaxID=1076443 RepID=A0A2T0UEW5_9ACTN|nr:hypothetical protein [Glycomyces artemisiae]PRY56480.1 hypothetical protein B0I28_109129 [Glycomyces artemisiae]
MPADLTPVEKAVYDAMIAEATPRVRDGLYGLEGEEIARAVVAAARGPILAEAADNLAAFVAERAAGKESAR